MDHSHDFIKITINQLKNKLDQLEQAIFSHENSANITQFSLKFDPRHGLDLGLQPSNPKADFSTPTTRSLAIDILSRRACGRPIRDLSFVFGHSKGSPESLSKRLSEFTSIITKFFPGVSPPERNDDGFDPPVCFDMDVNILKDTWERIGGQFYQASRRLTESSIKGKLDGISIVHSLILCPSMSLPWIHLASNFEDLDISAVRSEIDSTELMCCLRSSYRWFSIREDYYLLARRKLLEGSEQLDGELHHVRNVLSAAETVAMQLDIPLCEIENPFNRIAIQFGRADSETEMESVFRYDKFLSEEDCDYVDRTLEIGTQLYREYIGNDLLNSRLLLKALIPKSPESGFRRLFDLGRTYSVEVAASRLVKAIKSMYRSKPRRIRNRRSLEIP